MSTYVSKSEQRARRLGETAEEYEARMSRNFNARMRYSKKSLATIDKIVADNEKVVADIASTRKRLGIEE